MQLELLWNLQSVDSEISRLQRFFEDRTMYKELCRIKREYNGLKDDCSKSCRKLSEDTKLSETLNSELKKMDQKLKESNEGLYRDGVDLKTIGCLQADIESLKRKIDNIEGEVLSLMENIEKLDSDIAGKKSKLSELKSAFENLKKEYTDKDKEVREKIEKLMKNRRCIEEKIDVELVNQYNRIASSGISPVSKVVNGTCTGCSVKLNAMLCEELKKDDCIKYCEHCGRILYSE